MPSNSVRVRFAPSPTGFLHIGGLRTALFCYLFARRNAGIMVLRIEDTDQSRFVPEAETDITECLAWMGIQIDEGPAGGGALGPYRQSERKAIYHRYVRRLLGQGLAYYAFDTPEELQALRDQGAAYDGTSRQRMRNSLTLPTEEITRKLNKKRAPYHTSAGPC